MRTKGLAYYSDCRGDGLVLSAVRRQLQRAAPGFPVVSVTLAPVMGFGTNVVLSLERGYAAMFRQQLAAIESLETDIVFMCEHDVLYSSTHFSFTPPRDDTFYYNQHTWRVDRESGRALFYYCNQVSGLCASRALLLEHYQKRVAYVEKHGFQRRIGFEPGGNRLSRELFGERLIETWMSEQPNLDIKTQFSLTPGRWQQEQFRNKSTCLGWTEGDSVPGWGRTRGRMEAFLGDIERGAPAAEESMYV